MLSVFAFQEAGLDTRNWHSAVFLVPLLVGICCWVALTAWELAVARRWSHVIDGIIPLRLVQNRVYAAGTAVTTLTGFTYFVVVYSIPFRFEIMNLKSPLGAGVGILPLVGAAAVGSMMTGFVNAKKDMTFYTRLLGGCLVLIGAGLLTTLKNTLAVQNGIYGYQVFVGLGFGLIVASTSVMVNYEVGPRDTGMTRFSPPLNFLFSFETELSKRLHRA